MLVTLSFTFDCAWFMVLENANHIAAPRNAMMRTAMAALTIDHVVDWLWQEALAADREAHLDLAPVHWREIAGTTFSSPDQGSAWVAARVVMG